MRELTGRFFHRFDGEGYVEWQGLVHSSPAPGWFLVELFDWLIGEGGVFRLVQIEAMASWHFYETANDMDAVYREKYLRRAEERDVKASQ